ncbi:hypothetical protein LWI28_010297 [Acer negundo]|uniref:Uncharacterized protein n=1 Tax=Acer negundo TaxID=4023 RepID=A0AAD5IQC3_ACENE|nr:hypothetical protein LWI28_010297 [Acer negundo]
MVSHTKASRTARADGVLSHESGGYEGGKAALTEDHWILIPLYPVDPVSFLFRFLEDESEHLQDLLRDICVFIFAGSLDFDLEA